MKSLVGVLYRDIGGKVMEISTKPLFKECIKSSRVMNQKLEKKCQIKETVFFLKWAIFF